MNQCYTRKLHNEAQLLLRGRPFRARKDATASKELAWISCRHAATEARYRMRRPAIPWLRIIPLLLLVALCTPAPLLAEGLRLLGDLEYRSSFVDTTDKQTGETTDGEFARFTQLYDLSFQRQLYPYLEIRAGGLFDLRNARTTNDGIHSRIDDRTWQYFAGLHLNQPLHKAGFTYRRTDLKTSASNLFTRSIFRDQYIANWTWRPDDLPLITVNYDRAHTFDKPQTRDSIAELLTLRSRYDYRDASLDYTYTRNDAQENLTSGGSLSQIHNTGIRYSRRFLDDRIGLTAGARINYSTLEPSDDGDIHRPTTSRGVEFWLLDDSSPDSNASGEFTTVDPGDDSTALTNVDIGGDAPPEPVSVGLDFGSSTDVDTIYVLPLEDDNNDDLANPAEIEAASDTFSWEVFWSDDQETWTQCAPSVACEVEWEYNLFDNRFEISFSPGVNRRYIKVWTRPSSDPSLGQVLISSVRGFTTISVSAGTVLNDLDQNYNLGVRWSITDRSEMNYDAYYKVVTADPSSRRKSTLTNSVSLRHIFNPVFVGNARFLRSDGRATARHNEVYQSYVASIRGDYLETLSQTLVYSGTHTKDGNGTSTVNSLFLRSNADLYRDWSMNLYLGQSWTNSDLDGSSRSTAARIRTDMAPNRKLHLALDYSITWIVDEDEGSRLEQNGNVQGFYVPFRTLSLFAAVRFRNRDQGNRSTTVSQDYSVNWAPFLDGSLNFSIAYTQAKTTLGYEEKLVKPEVRWQIARGMLLIFTYSNGTVESATETSDIQTFTGNLRVFY